MGQGKPSLSGFTLNLLPAAKAGADLSPSLTSSPRDRELVTDQGWIACAQGLWVLRFFSS